ncbi:MAG: alpha-amylase [Lachnospiraceae bacterium]|nr:alpha-amylase [Lachnospiraceae bacterium]
MNNRENLTLMQGFEWYLPADHLHWRRIASKAEELSRAGIDMIWLPPSYKGAGGDQSVGYDVYDKYDLGEFDQKGSISTKYGTKEEYLACVEALHNAGIRVISDIVLDHLMGADETERITVVEDSFDDRNQQISGELEINAWTRFTYPGRKGRYSKEQWDFHDFNGTDFDDEEKRTGLFRIEGKTWNRGTDWDFGNFDYLMGACLDMENPEVVKKLTDWGKWFLDTTNTDGLRLDAVKHISHEFFLQWIRDMREHKGDEFFVVGEYWHGEIERLLHYLDAVENAYALFDVPLHYALMNAGNNREMDLTNLLKDSLLAARPDNAVLFVDNHDTQPGQALYSFVPTWFKPQAYSIILFQEAGYPCVFYGDLYGIPHDNIPPVTGLAKLCQARKVSAYGTQKDYYDDAHVVGYTRAGDAEHEGSGMAVLITNNEGGSKRMYVSMKYAGECFVNLLKPTSEKVVLGDDGCGEFYVERESAAVWVRESGYEKIELGEL